MNASTIVPSNSTTSPSNNSHDMGKIFWISIGGGALLIMVVAVIIVMKCVSAQRKKTSQDSSAPQTSQAKKEMLGFTNKIHTESA